MLSFKLKVFIISGDRRDTKTNKKDSSDVLPFKDIEPTTHVLPDFEGWPVFDSSTNYDCSQGYKTFLFTYQAK